MKYFVFFILLFAGSLEVKAQNIPSLVLDENGKYIYYEVVNQAGYTKEQLQSNASSFLKKEKLVTQSRTDTSLIASGKFVIRNSLLKVKHPVGETSFDLTIEFKDHKYRFWLTNFDYSAYKFSRYGDYRPDNSLSKPLETKPSKLDKMAWKGIISSTEASCKAFAERLKLSMLNSRTVKEKKKQVIKKDW